MFHTSDEAIIIELKLYTEDWGGLIIKNRSYLSCPFFLQNYGCLDLYDEDLEKRFIIDHEKLEFDKNSVWNLIGIPEKPDGTFSDHEYFCIYDDLFDRTRSTHQDINIMRKFISKEPNEIILKVTQQRYTMTKSKIIRGVLPKNQPRILFRERDRKKLTMGTNNFMNSG